MTWFYFSFCDPSLPTGSQFLGGCYVRAPEDEASLLLARVYVESQRAGGPPPSDEEALLAATITESHRLGINPGGEICSIGPITDGDLEAHVPEHERHRLLSREEVEAR